MVILLRITIFIRRNNMNYFGVERKIKVVNKVTPRDMDRSKMFTKVPPVMNKKYVVRCQVGDSDIRTLLKTVYKVNILHSKLQFVPESFYAIYIFHIEATDTQAKVVECLIDCIEIKELV